MTGLAAAYASMNDGKYLLTNADKVGNTPAWQNRYRVNESTGEMLYEMADHLKESYEQELIAQLDETLAELARLDEGKMPAGLQAYIDKKKGGKKEKEENGDDNGKSSKGSKPDFLDLDKDGDKKEPMKKAAKEKKEETEYNYVNAYVKKMNEAIGEGDPQDDAVAQMSGRGGDPQSDAVKQYVKYSSKTSKKKNANAAKKITKENVEALVSSGFFTAEEVSGILWSEFDESREYSHNPEKYHDSQGRDKKLEMDKPYAKRSRSARMKDPERGINSPAFKKFMADRGM